MWIVVRIDVEIVGKARDGRVEEGKLYVRSGLTMKNCSFVVNSHIRAETVVKCGLSVLLTESLFPQWICGHVVTVRGRKRLYLSIYEDIDVAS